MEHAIKFLFVAVIIGITVTYLSHRIFGVALICWALLSIGAQAQSTSSQGTSSEGPVQSNQPIREYIQEFFLSEAVRNQDRGEFQFTLGSDSRQNLGSNLALDIEYGLTNRVQLSSETFYGFSASAKSGVPAGWSTTNVGLNYQIIRSNSPFALAIGASFGVPVQNRCWIGS